MSAALDPGSAGVGSCRYALGLISGHGSDPKVVLLRRLRPEPMYGKLYGFGAQIKPHESAAQAMQRKLCQKAGRDFRLLDWRHFADVQTPDGLVVCLHAVVLDHVVLELSLLDGDTDERLETWRLHAVLGSEPNNTPPLLRRLLKMAFDRQLLSAVLGDERGVPTLIQDEGR